MIFLTTMIPLTIAVQFVPESGALQGMACSCCLLQWTSRRASGVERFENYPPEQSSCRFAKGTIISTYALNDGTLSQRNQLIHFLTVQKSFHCFIQAAKLFGPWHEETAAILDEPSLKALNAELASHWCEFGYHLYSTTCSPMSMAAFKRRYPKPVMNSDGSRSFVEIAEPKEVHVYKFALMCFRIALQLDDNDWRCEALEIFSVSVNLYELVPCFETEN